MKLDWCNKCVLPNTRPNLQFNIDGICSACINHQKKNINWKKRYDILKKLVKKIKNKKRNFDCLIPVSGGKDSTWQVHVAQKLGLKCLTYTYKPFDRTKIGSKNLKNLISLGVDHIDWTLNPILEKKMLLQSFKKLGSTAIVMHLMIHNISQYLAIQHKIPLIIWGENSDTEYGTGNLNNFVLDDQWRKKYSVTQNSSLKDFLSKNITKEELLSIFPNYKKKEVLEIFLGSFIKWDPKLIYKYSKKIGFVASKKPITGLYKYADIDDELISIHHWLKWYKFGFTRDFDNLSIEIRSGRLSRSAAIKIIKKIKIKPPLRIIKKFCKVTNISIRNFFKICEKFRNKKIWYFDKKKKWKIKHFIY